MPNTIEKISSFAYLPDNWHFGEGKAPTPEVIAKAIEINNLGVGKGLDTEAFPGVDGSISLSFYAVPYFFDVSIEPDLRFTTHWEIGVGVNYDIDDFRENDTLENINSALDKLVGKLKG